MKAGSIGRKPVRIDLRQGHVGINSRNLLKGGLTAGVMLGAMPLASISGLQVRKLAPWIPNIVTTSGILRSGQDLLGDRPVILPIALRLGITMIVFASLSCAIAALLERGMLPKCGRRRRSYACFSVSAELLWMFSFMYFFLLLIPAYEGLSSDRHVLLVLLAAVVLILQLFEFYPFAGCLDRMGCPRLVCVLWNCDNARVTPKTKYIKTQQRLVNKQAQPSAHEHRRRSPSTRRDALILGGYLGLGLPLILSMAVWYATAEAEA